MSTSERAERDSARRLPYATLWLGWVIATSIAATLGLVAADAPIVGMPDYNFADDNAVFPLVSWGCVLILVMGPLVGLAQGAVLGFFAQLKYWHRWIVVTSLAVIMAEIVGTLLGVATAGSAADFGWAVMPGFVLGYLQWLVLQREVRGAAWWVAGSGIAWVAGVAAGALVSGILFSQVGPGFPFYPIEAAVKWGVGWCVGAVVYGAISGAVLVRLLYQSRYSRLDFTQKSERAKE